MKVMLMIRLDWSGVTWGKLEPVQPFGFTGYQYDRTADTYFAQMREYQPETGRFAAWDIVPGFKDMPFTMNRYTYCYNNPVLLVDWNEMFLLKITINK